MSNYNTGNPVPSVDPRDLDDNATVFDKLLQQAVPSVPDRLGVARKTWWQMEQDALALISPNISALAGLTGAADRLAYFTGVGAMALTPLTAVARALLDDTTQAAMQSTLGLVPVTTTTDSTSGRVITVGYCGLGGAAVLITDANSPTITGKYRLASSASNLPVAESGTLDHVQVVASIATQLFISQSTGKTYVRWMAASVWQSWILLAAAGVNTSITSLTGLTTALSVAQGGTGGNTAPLARAALGILNVGVDYVDGLGLTWISANALTVQPGAAYIPSSGTVLSAAAAIAKTGLTLTAATKYHVYLFNNAGNADIEIVTTAPSAKYGGTGRTKTGDTTRRYLGSIYTAGANTILRFKHIGDKMLYLADYLSAPLAVLSFGAATTSTAVSLAGCVPETAIAAKVSISATHTNAAAAYINDADMGAVTSSNSISSIGASRQFTQDLPISAASQTVNYIYDIAPTGGSLYLRVQGYIFER